MRHSSGTTLMELLVVLAVTGVLTTLAVPRLVGGADAWIVREAREEVVALFYRARMEARRRGGATLLLESGGGAELRVAGTTTERWEPSVPGLRLEVAGARDEAEIAFGPSGTGRFANATLLLRRGGAEREIVVSSYGRVRR